MKAKLLEISDSYSLKIAYKGKPKLLEISDSYSLKIAYKGKPKHVF